MKQMTLVTIKGLVHGRVTRKATFLARMGMLVPWTTFCELIEPHCPKVGNGCPLVSLERMLRMYLIVNWFSLAEGVRISENFSKPSHPPRGTLPISVRTGIRH